MKGIINGKEVEIEHRDLGQDIIDGAWVSVFSFDGKNVVSRSYIPAGVNDALAERWKADKAKLLEAGVVIKER